MFGPIMDTCKVCNKEVEADLCAHGPNICIISYGCGHTMKATKQETVWINDATGNIDHVEENNA